MNRRDRILLILLFNGAILCGSGFMTFGLWFAPGWSNGWPVHRSVVWPIGVSGAVFAGVFLFLIGLGAMASISPSDPEWPFGTPSRTWIVVSLVLSAAITAPAFLELRSQALEIWP